MLLSLKVQNFALIRSLSFSPKQGLNVITGETGAGKSILLGALGLVTGNRAEMSALLNKNEKCVVEAEFDISALNLSALFETLELDYEPITIVRREITPQGKSRAFVNDTPVQLSVLKTLSQALIQVHTQNTGVFISDPAEQLKAIDAFASHSPLLLTYQESYREWKQLTRELDGLLLQKSNFEREQEFIRFQFDELNSFSPVSGEEIELDEQIAVLGNADEIGNTCKQAMLSLTENEHAIADQINTVKNLFKQVEKYSAKAGEIKERLQIAANEIKDCSREIEALSQTTESNPEVLESLNNRHARLQLLLRKHQANSASDLVSIMQGLDERLQDAHQLDERIASIGLEINEKQALLKQQGILLHESRLIASQNLLEGVTDQLKLLGMPRATMDCTWQHHEDKPEVYGLAKATLLFSANAGSAPLPLDKAASGGELSRINFCFKALTAAGQHLPTLIYDEADTGISGSVAASMGKLMRDMGQNHQVITITHIPQVAAAGKHHFFVYKAEHEENTESKMKVLTEEERVQQIASMLSGSNPGTAALANASELLKSY